MQLTAHERVIASPHRDNKNNKIPMSEEIAFGHMTLVDKDTYPKLKTLSGVQAIISIILLKYERSITLK